MGLFEMISEGFRSGWNNILPFLGKYLMIFCIILVLRIFSFGEFKEFMVTIIRGFLRTVPIVSFAALVTLFYPILFLVAIVLGGILILAGVFAISRGLIDKLLKTYKT